MGVEISSWIGNPLFDRLIELSLSGYTSCTHLPTLGYLSSLEVLYVTNMDEMKTLGIELLTTANSFHHVAFPSLEVVEISNVKRLEKCSFSGGDNNGIVGSFPHLCRISL